jgi:hypothetical protein
MKKACLSSLIFFMFYFPITVLAQDKPSWVSEVETVLEKKEPKWKVADRRMQGGPQEFIGSITLKSGALRADITIHIRGSAQYAKEQFDEEKIAFTQVTGDWATQVKLPALGDDNYMLVGKRKKRWSNIFFRQGNVLVKVFAPDAVTAKRFAQYVAERIPAI